MTRKVLNKNFSSRNSQKTGLAQAKKIAWHNGCLIRFSRIEEDETGNPLRTNKYRDYEPSVDRKFVENGTQRITKNLLQPEAKRTGRCKFSTLRRPVSFWGRSVGMSSRSPGSFLWRIGGLPQTSSRALRRSRASRLSACHNCNSFEATTAALAAKAECDAPPTWNARHFLAFPDFYSV